MVIWLWNLYCTTLWPAFRIRYRVYAFHRMKLASSKNIQILLSYDHNRVIITAWKQFHATRLRALLLQFLLDFEKQSVTLILRRLSSNRREFTIPVLTHFRIWKFSVYMFGRAPSWCPEKFAHTLGQMAQPLTRNWVALKVNWTPPPLNKQSCPRYLAYNGASCSTTMPLLEQSPNVVFCFT